jgi:hypothetical protein
MASYRVDRTFIGMQEGNVSSTRIDNLPDYFLVTADQDYYSEMSVTEMTGCKGKSVKFVTWSDLYKLYHVCRARQHYIRIVTMI